MNLSMGSSADERPSKRQADAAPVVPRNITSYQCFNGPAGCTYGQCASLSTPNFKRDHLFFSILAARWLLSNRGKPNFLAFSDMHICGQVPPCCLTSKLIVLTCNTKTWLGILVLKQLTTHAA